MLLQPGGDILLINALYMTYSLMYMNTVNLAIRRGHLM
jgi:hypothetical protein